MSITVKVGGQEETNEAITLKLKVRKTIDGNIMILDHDDVDIIIMPSQKKIVIFPKTSFHDNVYATQDRLFNFLALKGTIKRESIQAGDVYASLECAYPETSNGADSTQLILFSIGKFIEEEKPHIEAEKQYEEEFEKSLTNPDEEDSTELGEIPQKAKKGSIPSGKIRNYLSGGSYYG